MRTSVLTLAVCLTGAIAHATPDLDYKFNKGRHRERRRERFHGTVGVDVGATSAFTPFVTDGTHSWVMTKDLLPGFDFNFGTGGATFPGCGIQVSNAPDGGFFLASALPTATGTFGLTAGDLFDVSGGQHADFKLTGSPTVSAVPEPTSILLLGSILGAVGLIARRRMRHRSHAGQMTL